MTKMSKGTTREKIRKSIGNQQRYISRITKTLYYGKFPKTDGLSLPVTELAAELFSESQHGHSIDRLHCSDAANISRNACVSPCSLVLAILYLEKLKRINPEYLEKTSPFDVFLVSLMVSCKYLYDDGQIDEVFVDEWAESANIPIKQLILLEKNFLRAIDWEIYVDDLMFWRKLTEIEKILADRQGTARGFYTYTELQNLLKTINIHNVIQHFATVFTLLTASYTAAFLALFGSIWVVSTLPGTFMQLRKMDAQESRDTNSNIFPVVKNLSQNNMETDELHTLEMVNTQTCITLLLDEKEDEFDMSQKKHFSKPSENFVAFKNESSSEDDRNVQNVTYEWWSVPVMEWLPQMSKAVEVNFSILNNYLTNFIETFMTKAKYLDLEDQVHKATKTRIQDQMENKWHKEWIETINFKLYKRQSFRFF